MHALGLIVALSVDIDGIRGPVVGPLLLSNHIIFGSIIPSSEHYFRLGMIPWIFDPIGKSSFQMV